MKQYIVIYERGETGWGAYAPDVPGCIAVAKTRTEVERRFKEALIFHLEGIQAAGDHAPEPASEAGLIAVDDAPELRDSPAIPGIHAEKLTTAEAATALGVQPKTVTRYIARGLITATKWGRDYQIARDEITRFQRDRRSVGYPSGQPRRSATE